MFFNRSLKISIGMFQWSFYMSFAKLEHSNHLFSTHTSSIHLSLVNASSTHLSTSIHQFSPIFYPFFVFQLFSTHLQISTYQIPPIFKLPPINFHPSSTHFSPFNIFHPVFAHQLFSIVFQISDPPIFHHMHVFSTRDLSPIFHSSHLCTCLTINVTHKMYHFRFVGIDTKLMWFIQQEPIMFRLHTKMGKHDVKQICVMKN